MSIIVISNSVHCQSLLDYEPVWESPTLSNNFTFFNTNLSLVQTDKQKIGLRVTPFRFGISELNSAKLFYTNKIWDFNIAVGLNGITNKLFYEMSPTVSCGYVMDKLQIGFQFAYSRMQIQNEQAFDAIKIDLAAKLKLDENISAAVLLKNINDGKYAGNSQTNKSSIMGFCYEKDNSFGAIDVEIRQSFGTAFVFSGGSYLNDQFKAKLAYKTYPQTIYFDLLMKIESNQIIASFSYLEKIGISPTIGYSVEF